MSTLAAANVDRIARFYDSTIGKKAVMAVTGLVLFGYLIVHVLGNLQIFLGAEVMNGYAALLHGNPGFLWTIRIVLLAAVILHIWAAVQLTALKKTARPTAYVKPGNVSSSYASRTMMLSGPIIFAFLVYHILHLTTGTVHPQFAPVRPYENLIQGFRDPLATLVYVVAMILVGMHLSHGIWSMFQSIGFSHPRYTPFIKKFAAIFAWIIVAGFLAVPFAVWTGLVN